MDRMDRIFLVDGISGSQFLPAILTILSIL